jgi:Arc/MetJ-type ribon-helix-helix transcriptional regulator
MPTVEIPEKMYEMIEQIIKEDPALGYEDPEEFAREAIRKQLVEF